MQQPIRDVAPRQAGQPGTPSTSVRALTGVFETLVNEHRKASDMFQRIAHQSAEQRQQSWPILRRQLLSHERAEVLEVYSALEGFDAARDILKHHEQESGELESAINELDAIDYDRDEWIAKFRDIVALVEDHVRDEESEYFPRAQELLGEAAARELHERFVSAQREVIHTLP